MPKNVGVKLSDEEYQQLSKQPGQTDAARVRSLLHQKTLAEEISSYILAQIQDQQLNWQQADLNQHIKRLEDQINVLGHAMNLLLRIHLGKSTKNGAKPQASPETPIMGKKTMKTRKRRTRNLWSFFRNTHKNRRHITRRPEWEKDLRIARHIFLLK